MLHPPPTPLPVSKAPCNWALNSKSAVFSLVLLRLGERVCHPIGIRNTLFWCRVLNNILICRENKILFTANEASFYQAMNKQPSPLQLDNRAILAKSMLFFADEMKM